jgi:glycosyltransferase involved in cell wall biosynthesis
MMRVGLLFEYPTVNGGENSMLAAAQFLCGTQTTGVEFHALAPAGGDLAKRLDDAGFARTSFEIFQAGVRRDRAELAAELATLAEWLKLDLLHANSLSMGRLLGAASGELPCPTSAHLRDILKLSAAAVRDLNRNVRLIAVSEVTRLFHIEQGLDAERVVTIHNGIDAEQFIKGALPDGEPDSASVRDSVRVAVRAEFGIREDSFVFLSVGQIGLRKGLDTLADAAVLLSGEVEESKPVHVLLVGARFSTKTESIEFEQRLHQRFGEAAPTVVLHATGYREDVPRLMLGADALVHAARQEPLGRVLLEAGAMRLPILATDVGGTREIFSDDQSAILVTAGQPTELCQEMSRVLADASLRSRLGLRGEATVCSQFGIARAGVALATAWREICGIIPKD